MVYDGLDQGSRNTKHKKGSISRFVYRLDMESEKKRVLALSNCKNSKIPLNIQKLFYNRL